MRFLDREFGKSLAEMVDCNSEYHLLTDGKHLYLETSARQIVDILKNSRPGDSGRMPERRGAAGEGGGYFGQGKYFSNVA